MILHLHWVTPVVLHIHPWHQKTYTTGQIPEVSPACLILHWRMFSQQTEAAAQHTGGLTLSLIQSYCNWTSDGTAALLHCWNLDKQVMCYHLEEELKCAVCLLKWCFVMLGHSLLAHALSGLLLSADRLFPGLSSSTGFSASGWFFWALTLRRATFNIWRDRLMDFIFCFTGVRWAWPAHQTLT